jgi:hypothetical protein
MVITDRNNVIFGTKIWYTAPKEYPFTHNSRLGYKGYA